MAMNFKLLLIVCNLLLLAHIYSLKCRHLLNITLHNIHLLNLIHFFILIQCPFQIKLLQQDVEELGANTNTQTVHHKTVINKEEENPETVKKLSLYKILRKAQFTNQEETNY